MQRKCAFFTVRTQIVFAYFSKKWHFLQKGTIFFTTTQKHNFTVFFEAFLFHFSYFLFCFFQHKKDKKKTSIFFVRKPFFDTLTNCQKIFSHPYALFVILRCPPNAIKLWKTSKNILDQVLTQPWTKFWLKKLKSWTKFWLYSTYRYAVESKLGPKIAFFWVKTWSKFSLFFFFVFQKSSSFCRENEIFKKNEQKNKKNTIFWVKTWSNFVAQHTWTKFWLNIFANFWLFYLFEKMLKPLFL